MQFGYPLNALFRRQYIKMRFPYKQLF
ncbi:hypothetical protein EMIT0194P_100062 [Pseudomonas serbica]